jgi:concentrative nucleoside transporter, CNT family
MIVLRSFTGLLAFAFFAWILSENRRKVNLKTVIIGLSGQIVIAVILLKLPFFKDLFFSLNNLVLSLEESAKAGTSFVFGYLGGAVLPFDEKIPGASYILAFRGLALVLFMSALSALLFYWKILPVVVKSFSWLLQKTMQIGGAEGVGAASNIFIGMIEAPLFIRPYLKNMTRSEIFSLMTCGMATIAGTVMVLYASILSKVIPDAMGHILIASIISAPAAITVAKIMIPETTSITSGEIIAPENYLSSMDAITKGTVQGVQLLINIIAMLIVLVALVHLFNIILGLLPDIRGEAVTLQRILGYIMAPVVWLMGIPTEESFIAGSLMGTKTVLNEFIAYIEMSKLPPGTLSTRSMIIMTYGMCGFANPGSLGIMIGGMGTMAPERRDEIVSLGFRSIIAGTIAACMTGTVAGMIEG